MVGALLALKVLLGAPPVPPMAPQRSCEVRRREEIRAGLLVPMHVMKGERFFEIVYRYSDGGYINARCEVVNEHGEPLL